MARTVPNLFGEDADDPATDDGHPTGLLPSQHLRGLIEHSRANLTPEVVHGPARSFLSQKLKIVNLLLGGNGVAGLVPRLWVNS